MKYTKTIQKCDICQQEREEHNGGKVDPPFREINIVLEHDGVNQALDRDDKFSDLCEQCLKEVDRFIGLLNKEPKREKEGE